MRYFLIVVFVGISVFSFAEKTVSRAIYEAEVDKLNCALAKFYMEKEQGVYTLSAYEDSLAITGCNFEHLMVFIKERQPQMEINGELAVYIESFKNEYDKSVNNNVLYNKLIDVFQQATLDKYSNKDDFISLKMLFIDRLKQNLKVEEIGNAVNQEIAETESFADSFSNFGWQEAALILITILIIFIFVSLISWFYKYSTTGKTPVIKNTQKSLPPQQTVVTTTTTTINDLHAQPKSALPEPTIPTTIVNIPQPTKTKVLDDVKEAITPPDSEDQPNENIFYMPYPSVDGSFYEYGKHDTYEEGKSTFKFDIKLKEYNLATFEVISNQDVITDALMNFEKTLNAVCEVIGSGTAHDKNHEIMIKPGLKRIITVEPGTVQLKTQHWRLKQKAKIKLEY